MGFFANFLDIWVKISKFLANFLNCWKPKIVNVLNQAAESSLETISSQTHPRKAWQFNKLHTRLLDNVNALTGTRLHQKSH